MPRRELNGIESSSSLQFTSWTSPKAAGGCDGDAATSFQYHFSSFGALSEDMGSYPSSPRRCNSSRGGDRARAKGNGNSVVLPASGAVGSDRPAPWGNQMPGHLRRRMARVRRALDGHREGKDPGAVHELLPEGIQ